MNRERSVHNDTCNCQPTRQSRRLLIGQGLVATACGLTGWLRHQTSLSAAVNPTPSHASGAPADIAPAEALKKLYEGNQRFASGKPLAENRDMDRVRALAAGHIGSLEFGTRVLGARVLYVLGHTECGAVHATMKGDEVPGQISGLFQYIRPAVRQAPDLAAAVNQNVRNQALLLAESSPVIGRLLRQGELIIAGGVYDLKTGVVTPVEIAV